MRRPRRCRGASQGRGSCPSRRQEGGAEGCPAAGRRTEGAGSAAAPTPGRSTSAPSRASAAPARCGSAAASTPPPPPPAAAPPPRPRHLRRPRLPPRKRRLRPAAPGGCTFAPDAAATPSAGSSTHGTEATCRTDSATAAAFSSEGDAITCAAAPAPAVWRHEQPPAPATTPAPTAPPTAAPPPGGSPTTAPPPRPGARRHRRGRSDCHANHTAGTPRCAAAG